MSSSHLILCCPLLLLSSIIPRIRVFSNESVLCIRYPKYWSFSFSISPSNEYSGLISFRMDWLDFPAVQETLKSLLQHHGSKASILWLSAFFIVHSHIHTWLLKKPKLWLEGPLFEKIYVKERFPWWLSGKEFTCQCWNHGIDLWLCKVPGRRKWQPTPVFLPGKSHGQRSLAGCSPWGHKVSDTTERLNNNNNI